MQISTLSAQRIVDEIGGIVRQNINMMDERGFIIASTDASRIGNFHEAAKKIIDDNLPELYISPAQATRSVKAGLNLPIAYDGRIFGVIGITGEYAQVASFGQIVKKMTEILLRESIDQNELRLKQRVISRFLEDWILGNGLLQPQALTERGLSLGLDITLPRRVLVISVQDLYRRIDTADGQRLIESIETLIHQHVCSEYGSLILRNASRQILLIRKRTDEQTVQLAQNLDKIIFETFKIHLAIGLDGDASDLHEAYLQASQAWRSALAARAIIRSYSQVTLEMFTGEIPRQAKIDFIRKIFRDCDLGQIRRWIQILEVYFAVDGSITSAAETLYIHKNTLQFKLKKLKEISGLDVRLPSNSAALYMAMLFFTEVESSLKHS